MGVGVECVEARVWGRVLAVGYKSRHAYTRAHAHDAHAHTRTTTRTHIHTFTHTRAHKHSDTHTRTHAHTHARTHTGRHTPEYVTIVAVAGEATGGHGGRRSVRAQRGQQVVRAGLKRARKALVYPLRPLYSHPPCMCRCVDACVCVRVCARA